MANREQLAIIKRARAGDLDAQLALGKLYLHGCQGLPQSSSTALHWLERAAQQGAAEAWRQIGMHISYEIAGKSERSEQLWQWYQRAFEDGVMEAGLVFARLVLEQAGENPPPQLLAQAKAALLSAAQAGIADAQWILAQHGPQSQTNGPLPISEQSELENTHWVASAARGGVTQAQQALAETAWQAENYVDFLEWALPLARNLAKQCQTWHVHHHEVGTNLSPMLAADEVLLLARCAQALADPRLHRDALQSASEIQEFCELAAMHGNADAQLQLGLWFSRIDATGERMPPQLGSANFKKAVRWLNLAAEQDMPQAWYALSRIYLKPEFSQRNVHDAQAYLERAAKLGHVHAQFECGANAWRNRREAEGNDVRALYWLQKAADQGEVAAQALLDKCAPPPPTTCWAQTALHSMSREVINSQPFLTARIELAALFGLSRAEALLLDVKQSDRGHCIEVDIRAQYGRSKRHLVLIRNGQQRQALDRITRLFEDVDCGPNGPEGNYRQRLYRLKTCLPNLPEDGNKSVLEMP